MIRIIRRVDPPEKVTGQTVVGLLKIFNIVYATLGAVIKSRVDIQLIPYSQKDRRLGYVEPITSDKNGDIVDGYQINMRTTFIEHMTPSEYEHALQKYTTFLHGLDTKPTDFNLFIIILLHEMGHVYFMEKFLEHSNIRTLVKMRNDLPKYIKKLLKKGKLSKSPIVIEGLSYQWYTEELIAENFALTHFPIVWKTINEMINLPGYKVSGVIKLEEERHGK
jgi:hypothetical protein